MTIAIVRHKFLQVTVSLKVPTVIAMLQVMLINW